MNDSHLLGSVQSMLPALREDAARRSGVAAADLRVMSVEDVTWSDGSLGCPQPGRIYTQALVPGHRVRIAAPGAPGAPMNYHIGTRGNGWLYCPAERAQEPLPREADPRR
jgi:hypothetical protein